MGKTFWSAKRASLEMMLLVLGLIAGVLIPFAISFNFEEISFDLAEGQTALDVIMKFDTRSYIVIALAVFFLIIILRLTMLLMLLKRARKKIIDN